MIAATFSPVQVSRHSQEQLLRSWGQSNPSMTMSAEAVELPCNFFFLWCLRLVGTQGACQVAGGCWSCMLARLGPALGCTSSNASLMAICCDLRELHRQYRPDRGAMQMSRGAHFFLYCLPTGRWQLACRIDTCLVTETTSVADVSQEHSTSAEMLCQATSIQPGL